MPANALTLTAQWTINSYTLTFDSAGGSAVQSLTLDFGSPISAPQAPVKEGHTFTGWSQAVPSTMPANALTLTAQWIEIQYSILYHNLDYAQNNIDNPIHYTHSSPFINLLPASRVGFTFIDWFDNSDLTGLGLRVISSGSSQDFNLYAKWLINTYTLTFDSAGGAALDDLTADYQSPIDLPNPIKLGYRFEGWFENGIQVRYEFMPLENRILEARWSSLAYTLTLVNSITNEFTLLTADFETPLNLPIMVQEGYTFEGWLENNRPVRYTQMPEGDRTLIGAFKAKNYILNFSSEIGDLPAPIEGPYQSMISLPEMRVDHHHFKGWEGPDGLLQGVFEMPLHGATLKAVFEPKTYSIQLIDNGTLLPPLTAPYQSLIDLPTPSRLGYQFMGWTLDGTLINELTMSEKPIELISVYEPKAVSLTFKTPHQSFQTLLTTDQPITSMAPLNVPDRYIWIGYFTLPFGNGENLIPGRMIQNADTTLVFPYYLRADQTFETSTGRLSLNPYYLGNLDAPVNNEITMVPWGEIITFISFSLTIIGLYVISKGVKWNEKVL